MQPNINMIMVGARNIRLLRDFYEDGLGWSPWMPATAASATYKVGTAVLTFLHADYLALESGIAAQEIPKSIFAIFVNTKTEVDTAIQRAIAAGATITSAVRNRDQGLYSGYFTDPEGNGWEVVWSPHMPLAEDGSLTFSGQD